MQAPTVINGPFRESQLSIASPSLCDSEVGSPNIPVVRYSQRIASVPSRFEWIGFRQQRISRTLHVIAGEGKGPVKTKSERVSEYEVYSWASSLLGHGISWSMYRSYGQILPSLTAYPVVEYFESSLPFDITTASVLEVQKAFAANIIHPFTRDRWGRSLLHVSVPVFEMFRTDSSPQEAAFHQREDISRLLLAYGVRPDISRLGVSPLWEALHLRYPSSRMERSIDLLRVLLQDCDCVEDFDSGFWSTPDRCWYLFERDGIEWLWSQSSGHFFGSDLLIFHGTLFRNTLTVLCFDSCVDRIGDGILHYLRLSMTSEFRQQIEAGRYGILKAIFCYADYSFDSFSVGNRFIEVLARMGLDFVSCIMNELADMPDSILKVWVGANIKILFEHKEDQGWILGWEWHWDPESPCFLIASEFNDLAGAPDLFLKWPFSKLSCRRAWDPALEGFRNRQAPRFNRRMTSKARKERARTSQKIQRSKMPGTWDW